MYCAVLCSTRIPSPSHSKNIDTASPNWCPLPTETSIFNNIHIAICHTKVSLPGLVWITIELPLMHAWGVFDVEGVRELMTISKGQWDWMSTNINNLCGDIQGCKITTHAHNTFSSFIITMTIPLVMIFPPLPIKLFDMVLLDLFVALHNPAWGLM